MRVRCVLERLENLDDQGLIATLRKWFPHDPIGHLRRGAKYLVVAMATEAQHLWFYVVDEPEVGIPAAYPACLFEVIDPRFSRYWILGWKAGGNEKRGIARLGPLLGITDGSKHAILAFPEWAQDRQFYERLLDGSPPELALLESYQRKMLLEFQEM